MTAFRRITIQTRNIVFNINCRTEENIEIELLVRTKINDIYCNIPIAKTEIDKNTHPNIKSINICDAIDDLIEKLDATSDTLLNLLCLGPIYY